MWDEDFLRQKAFRNPEKFREELDYDEEVPEHWDDDEDVVLKPKKAAAAYTLSKKAQEAKLRKKREEEQLMASEEARKRREYIEQLKNEDSASRKKRIELEQKKASLKMAADLFGDEDIDVDAVVNESDVFAPAALDSDHYDDAVEL